MDELYYLVQGDTGPQLRVTITREDTGLPVDMTNAVPRFRFRRAGTEATLVTLTSSANAEDLSNGIAIFAWSAGDLDLPAGRYEGEIEVTFNEDDPGEQNEIETVYETLQFVLREDFG